MGRLNLRVRDGGMLEDTVRPHRNGCRLMIMVLLLLLLLLLLRRRPSGPNDENVFFRFVSMMILIDGYRWIQMDVDGG